MNRPYTANYAIGFMFVIGIILFFEGMCGIAYPDIFSYFDLSEDTVYIIAALSVIIFALAVMLFLGVPLAQKLSVIFLMISIVTNLQDVDPNYLDFLDIVVMVLSISSIVLLLYRPCREFYSGWKVQMRFED